MYLNAVHLLFPTLIIHLIRNQGECQLFLNFESNSVNFTLFRVNNTIIIDVQTVNNNFNQSLNNSQHDYWIYEWPDFINNESVSDGKLLNLIQPDIAYNTRSNLYNNKKSLDTNYIIAVLISLLILMRYPDVAKYFQKTTPPIETHAVI